LAAADVTNLSSGVSDRPMEVSMPLIMPTVGAYLLIAAGLGATAQALFGATSFF
jgi:hypothetical protein